jgi:hypothetical protein
MGEMRNACTRIFNLKGRDHMVDLDVNRMTLLEYILNKGGIRHELDSSVSSPMVGSSKNRY